LGGSELATRAFYLTGAGLKRVLSLDSAAPHATALPRIRKAFATKGGGVSDNFSTNKNHCPDNRLKKRLA
jgi:hypothetical protein